MRTLLTICAVAALGAATAACDRSPQANDGATAKGDTGVAPTAPGGAVADIGAADPKASGVAATGEGRAGISSGDKANNDGVVAQTTPPPGR
jgi:hypothetical protein